MPEGVSFEVQVLPLVVADFRCNEIRVLENSPAGADNDGVPHPRESGSHSGHDRGARPWSIVCIGIQCSGQRHVAARAVPSPGPSGVISNDGAQIIVTFAFTALLATMAPAAHAQARRGGGAPPVGHAVPRPGPAHPGGPGLAPPHPVYGPGTDTGAITIQTPLTIVIRTTPTTDTEGLASASALVSATATGTIILDYPVRRVRLSLLLSVSLSRAWWVSRRANLRRYQVRSAAKDALVYENLYLAGRVADFDGSNERLALPAGLYLHRDPRGRIGAGWPSTSTSSPVGRSRIVTICRSRSRRRHRHDSRPHEPDTPCRRANILGRLIFRRSLPMMNRDRKL